ncbi:MAG: TFIIB-type zinc ribbon-containing protein [Propionibacteriaceae bacterium]|nr:TFIIB-type zinc ribbon-containing protein [Propionibacteriaceae bacterium]
MALLEYKCPGCGGAIAFDANTQQLVCPFCDTTIDAQALQHKDAGLEQDITSEAIDWQYSNTQFSEQEQQQLASYVCTSCGGEIIADVTTGATTCPFCDNPVVMSSQFAGTVKPDMIIPFKMDKQKAVAKLKEHYKGKKLIPKVFKDENHLEEIKGVYVPFWLFDTDISGQYAFNATKVRSWSDSNYQYTETEHYKVMRGGSISFVGVPADGSSKMDNALMESIEPYNYAEVVPFQTAYLPGFMANKYDVTPDEMLPRVNKRLSVSTTAAVSKTVQGYASATPAGSKEQVTKRDLHYALLPVWILNTVWKNQRYVFAMNGQTGKFVGDLPLDTGAYWRWLILLFVGIVGGGILLVTLLGLM